MQDDNDLNVQEDETYAQDAKTEALEAEQSPASSEKTDAELDTDLEAGDLEADSDDSVEEEEDSEAISEAELRAAELSEEEKAERIQMLKPILEGALMAAGEALKLTKIQSLFDEHEMPSKGILLEALALIREDCDGRGFNLVEVASGWRFQVREDYAQWVNRLWDERPQKYSRALLETLALVAYRQPITRGDIEEVRGVAVSSHIMKTLTEREWVKVVGHRDVPGRPALYATTRQFLDYFNMKSLDELPTLGELKDIDSLNEALQLDEPLVASEDQSGDAIGLVEVSDSESLGDGTSEEVAQQEEPVDSDSEQAPKETFAVSKEMSEAVTSEDNIPNPEEINEEIANSDDEFVESGQSLFNDVSESKDKYHESKSPDLENNELNAEKFDE
jgi:segregation and condensation protein B